MMTSSTEAQKIVQITPLPESLLITHTQNHEAYKCPEESCSFTTTSPSLLGLHKAQVHKIKTVAKKGVVHQYFCPAPGCYFKPESGRFFKVLDHLKTHYMKVHCDKKFKCLKCQRAFGLERDCLRHEKVCGQIFTCTECGKEYNNKTALSNHCLSKGHKPRPSPPGVQKAPTTAKSNANNSKKSTPQRERTREMFTVPILPKFALPSNMSILIPTVRNDVTQPLCESLAALGHAPFSVATEASSIITAKDLLSGQVEGENGELTGDIINVAGEIPGFLGNGFITHTLSKAMATSRSLQPAMSIIPATALKGKSSSSKHFSFPAKSKKTTGKRQLLKDVPFISIQNCSLRSESKTNCANHTNETHNLYTKSQLNENVVSVENSETDVSLFFSPTSSSVSFTSQSEPMLKKMKSFTLKEKDEREIPAILQPLPFTPITHQAQRDLPTSRCRSSNESGTLNLVSNTSSVVNLLEKYSPTSITLGDISNQAEKASGIQTDLPGTPPADSSTALKTSYQLGSAMPRNPLMSVAQTQTFMPCSSSSLVNDSETQTLESFMLDSLNSLLTNCETQTFESSAPFQGIFNDSETQTMESDELLYQLLDDCENQTFEQSTPFGNLLNESGTQTFMKMTSDSVTQTLGTFMLDSTVQTSSHASRFRENKRSSENALLCPTEDNFCQVDPEELFSDDTVTTFEMMTQTFSDLTTSPTTSQASKIQKSIRNEGLSVSAFKSTMPSKSQSITAQTSHPLPVMHSLQRNVLTASSTLKKTSSPGKINGLNTCVNSTDLLIPSQETEKSLGCGNLTNDTSPVTHTSMTKVAYSMALTPNNSTTETMGSSDPENHSQTCNLSTQTINSFEPQTSLEKINSLTQMEISNARDQCFQTFDTLPHAMSTMTQYDNSLAHLADELLDRNVAEKDEQSLVLLDSVTPTLDSLNSPTQSGNSFGSMKQKTNSFDYTKHVTNNFDIMTQTVNNFGPMTQTANNFDIMTQTVNNFGPMTQTANNFDIMTQTADSYSTMTQTANNFDIMTQTANNFDIMTQTANNFDMMTQTTNNFDTMTQTTNNFDTMTQTTNNFDTMTQTTNNFDIMTQTVNNFGPMTLTANNFDIMTQTADNFDIMTQTANNFDTMTQTTNNFDMMTQTTNNFDTMTQTTNNFDMMTQTTNNFDTMTQTTNNFDTMTQTANNFDMMTQTANNFGTMTQTANSFDIMTQTANNFDMTTQTANNFDIMTQTANNLSAMTQTANNFDSMTQTANNFNMTTQTANNFDMTTQTANNFDIMTQTANNFDIMTQTANNFDIMTQTANNFDMMTQTANNFDIMTQTANYFDTMTQTANNFDIMTQTANNLSSMTQTANNFDIMTQTASSSNTMTQTADSFDTESFEIDRFDNFDLGCDTFTQTGDADFWEMTSRIDQFATQNSDTMTQTLNDRKLYLINQATKKQENECTTMTQTDSVVDEQWNLNLTSQATQLDGSDVMTQTASNGLWEMITQTEKDLESDISDMMTQTGDVDLWEMTTQTDDVQGFDQMTQTADNSLMEMITPVEQDFVSDMMTQTGDSGLWQGTSPEGFDLTCDIFTQTQTAETENSLWEMTTQTDDISESNAMTQTRNLNDSLFSANIAAGQDSAFDNMTQTSDCDFWESSLHIGLDSGSEIFTQTENNEVWEISTQTDIDNQDLEATSRRIDTSGTQTPMHQAFSDFDLLGCESPLASQ